MRDFSTTLWFFKSVETLLYVLNQVDAVRVGWTNF